MISGYNKVAFTWGPVEMTMPNNFLSVPNDQEILLYSVDDGTNFIYCPVCLWDVCRFDFVVFKSGINILYINLKQPSELTYLNSIMSIWKSVPECNGLEKLTWRGEFILYLGFKRKKCLRSWNSDWSVNIDQ